MKLRIDLDAKVNQLRSRIIDLELAGFARTFTQEQEMCDLRCEYNKCMRLIYGQRGAVNG